VRVGEAAQIMYTYVSKCKNDKRKLKNYKIKKCKNHSSITRLVVKIYRFAGCELDVAHR
jgi:hypothetical protein